MADFYFLFFSFCFPWAFLFPFLHSQATQILRQHGVLLPIIAVTGNALAEDGQLCLGLQEEREGKGGSIDRSVGRAGLFLFYFVRPEPLSLTHSLPPHACLLVFLSSLSLLLLFLLPVNAFIAAGCNHVLTKPINKKKLQEVLATYLPNA